MVLLIQRYVSNDIIGVFEDQLKRKKTLWWTFWKLFGYNGKKSKKSAFSLFVAIPEKVHFIGIIIPYNWFIVREKRIS